MSRDTCWVEAITHPTARLSIGWTGKEPIVRAAEAGTRLLAGASHCGRNTRTAIRNPSVVVARESWWRGRPARVEAVSCRHSHSGHIAELELGVTTGAFGTIDECQELGVVGGASCNYGPW